MRRFLFFFLFLVRCVWAADETPAVPQPKTIEEADAQRERASEMRSEAKKRYERESKACYGNFLVNACLEKAKERQTQTMIEARHLDAPARRFQQETRRAEADAEDKRKEAERTAREAGQKQRTADFHAKEDMKTAEREQKMTGRQRKIAETRRKNARKEVKRQEREKSRAERDAKRVAKKTREEAERDARIEARMPKP
ncbi:MAG: hypothetical protein LBD67_07785 [Candidatus Accumulibacter sp.]|jgi:hypothetical protein|nr:hypothetical protein [Accumulibacter sp.]